MLNRLKIKGEKLALHNTRNRNAFRRSPILSYLSSVEQRNKNKDWRKYHLETTYLNFSKKRNCPYIYCQNSISNESFPDDKRSIYQFGELMSANFCKKDYGNFWQHHNDYAENWTQVSRLAQLLTLQHRNIIKDREIKEVTNLLMFHPSDAGQGKIDVMIK